MLVWIQSCIMDQTNGISALRPQIIRDHQNLVARLPKETGPLEYTVLADQKGPQAPQHAAQDRAQNYFNLMLATKT